MFSIHVILGLAIIIISALLLLWNALRFGNGWKRPGFGRILTGLLDLQIVIGLIVFIEHPIWGWFLLHPIMMIIVVGLAHVLVSEKRKPQTQLIGYLLTTLLLMVGVYFAIKFG